MRRSQGMGIILVLLALVASCARSNQSAEPIATSGKYGSGVDLSFDEKQKEAAKKGVSITAPPGGAGSHQPLAGAPVPPRPPATAPQGNAGPYAVDFAALGTASKAILMGKNHKQLVVEINAAEGAEPTAGALSHLRQRLQDVVDKPGGIKFLPVKTFPPTKTTYTMNDVAALEKKYRKQKSQPTGPVVSIHMLLLNGQLDRGALGVAYYSTSVVIMLEHVRSVANPINRETLEEAAYAHEVGHVLGLVNIGYTSPRDHEDPDHKGHAKSQASVMFWALDRPDVLTILTGDVPTRYDADDLADLADRRAGKY